VKERHEKLSGQAAVKGTMLHAHLAWAAARSRGHATAGAPTLDAECLRLLRGDFLDTDWVPFRCLVQIDRALAATAAMPPEQVFRELGRHSASLNLAGAYKSFVADEPHRFFEKAARLNDRFQNFGRCAYQRLGERHGRMRHEGYEEYSPVYCASGLGYYEGALTLMNAPGPVHVFEIACQCAGDPACVFDLSW
jgi:predicted hydrocarbon binding protein